MKKLFSLLLVVAMVLSLGISAIAEEQVTITFQTWNPGDSARTHKIIEAFEAENPNIHIE